MDIVAISRNKNGYDTIACSDGVNHYIIIFDTIERKIIGKHKHGNAYGYVMNLGGFEANGII